MQTDAYVLGTSRLDNVLEDLRSEFSSSFIDQGLLDEVTSKAHIRVTRREDVYNDTVGENDIPPSGL